MTPTWGHGIVPGARVTSRGRHGAGQPPIEGTVVNVTRGEALVRVAEGQVYRRSVRNLRLVV